MKHVPHLKAFYLTLWIYIFLKSRFEVYFNLPGLMLNHTSFVVRRNDCIKSIQGLQMMNLTLS